jgi:hypothetical protein
MCVLGILLCVNLNVTQTYAHETSRILRKITLIFIYPAFLTEIKLLANFDPVLFQKNS